MLNHILMTVMRWGTQWFSLPSVVCSIYFSFHDRARGCSSFSSAVTTQALNCTLVTADILCTRSGSPHNDLHSLVLWVRNLTTTSCCQVVTMYTLQELFTSRFQSCPKVSIMPLYLKHYCDILVISTWTSSVCLSVMDGPSTYRKSLPALILCVLRHALIQKPLESWRREAWTVRLLDGDNRDGEHPRTYLSSG